MVRPGPYLDRLIDHRHIDTQRGPQALSRARPAGTGEGSRCSSYLAALPRLARAVSRPGLPAVLPLPLRPFHSVLSTISLRVAVTVFPIELVN